MPRTPKSKLADLPAIPPELLESFGNGPLTAEAINAASLAFKKALIERALAGEMNHHLGYPSGAAKPADVANQRNGKGAKTVLTEEGPVRIEVPRDRDGSFAPLLIPKHERRFTGFDDKIVAMYDRGMTVREIQGFLLEQYATEVSPEFISSVTDEVMAEVTAWQSRPLEPMYPVVFFDAQRVKIRQDAVVRNKAIYLALGVLPDGSRDIPGLWIEGTEGAKFWMKVFNDLKTRGCSDRLNPQQRFYAGITSQERRLDMATAALVGQAARKRSAPRARIETPGRRGVRDVKGGRRPVPSGMSGQRTWSCMVCGAETPRLSWFIIHAL